MATLRATVILPKLSGKNEDACRNVWHFSTGGAIGAADTTAVGDGLVAFYQGISQLIASSVPRSGSASRIEFAEVTRGGAGASDDVVSSLIGTRTFGLTTAGSGTIDLPAECAIALSFRGDVAGLQEEAGLIRPKSRRRGRVFLGPLVALTSAKEAVTNRANVGNDERTLIVNSYLFNLLEAINGPARVVHHIVYSPTSNQVTPVTLVHVDDAFDTIRSRGEKSVLRSVGVVNQPALVP
jgi:hypothetical protein